jgi:type I restriction enzyme S subunit
MSSLAPFTSDLKPYPYYKDSGVPWLGEVPQHWEMSRLGYSASLVVPMRDKPVDLSGDIPWIRIEDFSGRYIGASRTHQGAQDEPEGVPCRNSAVLM